MSTGQLEQLGVVIGGILGVLVALAVIFGLGLGNAQLVLILGTLAVVVGGWFLKTIFGPPDEQPPQPPDEPCP